MSAILFAAEYYPPFAPGGAEWSAAAWAQALVRRGHRVVVVTPNYGAPAREEREGVSVIRVPFPVKLAPGQTEAGWFAHRNPLFYLYFAWQLWRAGRAAGAGVIHSQGKGTLVPSWLAGRALHRPVVATIRDTGLLCPLGLCPLFERAATFDCHTGQYLGKCVPFFFEHYMPGASWLGRQRARLSLLLSWLDQRLRSAALRRVQGVIGVSRGILAIYPERLVDSGRQAVVHTLPPRVSLPTEEEALAVRRRLGIGPGPLVLYAGKLSLGKGTRVFIEAMEAVRQAVPEARFALAGKGELAVPPRDDLHVLGSIPQPDLFALYRAAEVVVVPSSWPEPLSRVLLEAMQLGRPVVATAVGGTPEAVEDGVTGLLVPREDARALGEAISALLRDPARRARMGEAARHRAALVFSEERIIASLLDAYAAAARREA